MLNTWPSAGSDINFHKQITERKKIKTREHFHGKVKNRIVKIHPPSALAHLWFLERQLPQSICCCNSLNLCQNTREYGEKHFLLPKFLYERDREPSGKNEEISGRGICWSVYELSKIFSGQSLWLDQIQALKYQLGINWNWDFLLSKGCVLTFTAYNAAKTGMSTHTETHIHGGGVYFKTEHSMFSEIW